MKLNSFRLILIIIIALVILVLIIIGLIYLIKYIKRKKEKKKVQLELSSSNNSTNETSDNNINNNLPSTSLSQNIPFKKNISIRELKINAFCDCFLKPVKYNLVKTYNDTCPIDLIKFDENNEISVTKCSHGFHYNCIKKYLIENENKNEFICPICLNVLFKLDMKV